MRFPFVGLNWDLGFFEFGLGFRFRKIGYVEVIIVQVIDDE